MIGIKGRLRPEYASTPTNGAVVLMEKGSRVLGNTARASSRGDGVSSCSGTAWSPRTGWRWTSTRRRPMRSSAPGSTAWSTPFLRPLRRRAAAVARGRRALGLRNRRCPLFRCVAGAQEAASVVLQSSINIAPTLRKARGSEIAIFGSHDLDFSGVYEAPISEQTLSLALEDVDMDAIPVGALTEAEVRALASDYFAHSARRPEPGVAPAAGAEPMPVKARALRPRDLTIV